MTPHNTLASDETTSVVAERRYDLEYSVTFHKRHYGSDLLKAVIELKEKYDNEYKHNLDQRTNWLKTIVRFEPEQTYKLYMRLPEEYVPQIIKDSLYSYMECFNIKNDYIFKEGVEYCSDFYCEKSFNTSNEDDLAIVLEIDKLNGYLSRSPERTLFIDTEGDSVKVVIYCDENYIKLDKYNTPNNRTRMAYELIKKYDDASEKTNNIALTNASVETIIGACPNQ